MSLEELKNKTILLFGKSRAFDQDEFEAQMQHHHITITKEYTDDVVLIVDGRMMTPYEHNTSELLYKQKKANFTSIDTLEKKLVNAIDDDTLLMSLKLSRNKNRLKSFIQNPMISDKLFFRLLKMYSFEGENFFDNDDNRDVTAALITRFYKNKHTNHNVEYATLGLMHLIVQSKNPQLIEAVAMLEPIQNSFNTKIFDKTKHNIITTIATHNATPKNILNMLIQKADSYVKTLIAMRKDCDIKMQYKLFDNADDDVLTALSYNSHLDKKLIKEFLKRDIHLHNIAKHVELDDEVFELLVQNHGESLAQNESLTYEYQKKLIAIHDSQIRFELASNAHLDEMFVHELICEGSEKINFVLYKNSATPQDHLIKAYEHTKNHIALSYNDNAPVFILEKLSSSKEIKVLQGLAQNPNTPVEILYQLQLDSRLERLVRENPAFGKHIQTENLGWLV